MCSYHKQYPLPYIQTKHKNAENTKQVSPDPACPSSERKVRPLGGSARVGEVSRDTERGLEAQGGVRRAGAAPSSWRQAHGLRSAGVALSPQCLVQTPGVLFVGPPHPHSYQQQPRPSLWEMRLGPMRALLCHEGPEQTAPPSLSRFSPAVRTVLWPLNPSKVSSTSLAPGLKQSRVRSSM